MNAIGYATGVLQDLLDEEAKKRGLGQPWVAVSVSLMEQAHPITDQVSHQPVATIILWFEAVEEGGEMTFVPPIAVGVLALMSKDDLSHIVTEALGTLGDGES